MEINNVADISSVIFLHQTLIYIDILPHVHLSASSEKKYIRAKTQAIAQKEKMRLMRSTSSVVTCIHSHT